MNFGYCLHDDALDAVQRESLVRFVTELSHFSLFGVGSVGSADEKSDHGKHWVTSCFNRFILNH